MPPDNLRDQVIKMMSPQGGPATAPAAATKPTASTPQSSATPATPAASPAAPPTPGAAPGGASPPTSPPAGAPSGAELGKLLGVKPANQSPGGPAGVPPPRPKVDLDALEEATPVSEIVRRLREFRSGGAPAKTSPGPTPPDEVPNRPAPTTGGY